MSESCLATACHTPATPRPRGYSSLLSLLFSLISPLCALCSLCSLLSLSPLPAQGGRRRRPPRRAPPRRPPRLHRRRRRRRPRGRACRRGGSVALTRGAAPASGSGTGALPMQAKTLCGRVSLYRARPCIVHVALVTSGPGRQRSPSRSEPLGAPARGGPAPLRRLPRARPGAREQTRNRSPRARPWAPAHPPGRPAHPGGSPRRSQGPGAAPGPAGGLAWQCWRLGPYTDGVHRRPPGPAGAGGPAHPVWRRLAALRIWPRMASRARGAAPRWAPPRRAAVRTPGHAMATVADGETSGASPQARLSGILVTVMAESRDRPSPPPRHGSLPSRSR